MIVKVQLALGGHIQHGRGLVYDQRREHSVEQPIPESVVKALNKAPNKKGFFHADWQGNFWAIGAGAEYQTW